ncbi:aldehyde dehydrogenase [Xylaria bambusicola]|uniref:aldehyde dehydrogenase n=1 Tax=Xylaria bambusicola TaxID=326684 RepID=UPI002007549F|nr:aldehyde dehydrogenase [Xylaria bambusicola]KAI0512624.1 aldehyde dehydrogenase [Xylaria bambusicola]
MAVNVEQPPHSLNLQNGHSVPEALNLGSRVNFTTYQNVIDGGLYGTDKTRRTIDPATLEENPEVPVSTRHDVDRAVAAAQKAAAAWAQVPWAEREAAVRAYADAVESHINEIAEIQVREMGCPLAMAEGDVQWGVGWMRGFCELPQPGDIIESSEDRHVVERYTPIGVAVGIVPWNGPVVLACGKIAPALLTGNALILKPSPFAPYSVLKLAEIGLQFFPPGVLQALSGEDDLGPWLTTHPSIGKVSFTGSGNTAKRVVEACSSSLKRVSTELGGNDPAIVCEDVDPVLVGQKIATVAMLRSGQFCIAIKRVYVHESIYDAVLAEIVKYVGSVKVDNGLDEGTVVGPVANRPQYERVKELLANIEETKLDVLPKKGQPIEELKGFFIRPIVINNPPDDSRVVVEEPFGPILPVMKWSDEADVIQRANNTDYGLGASVWSRDLVRATRIADKLQAGNVWINTHAEIQASTAFAGHKQSGYGSELGVDGLKGWCNIQAMYTRPL